MGKTTMTGTGNLDEDVTAANFDLEMKTAAGTVSCKGDAGTSKTCNLPLGTGSLTFNAMSFPIKKGSTSISVDLSLAAALPGALARTDTKVTATAANGDKLFCMEIKSAPAESGARDYSSYEFEHYLKEFGKSYEFAEYTQRKAIFDQNLLKVQKHNEEYKAGKHTWFAAVNRMADFTEKEFKQLRSAKYHPSQHPIVALGSKQGVRANPDSIDWREKGAVTPVKNQGGCGSCWTFSATETLESHYQIATKKTKILAPQTFVNCVKNPKHCGGTGGCEGATMELAFNLTADTGIALETDIPYRGQDEECKPYKAAVKCTGYVKNPVNDAAALETAVATKGPQAITVAAEPWMSYGGGVFNGCTGSLGADLDHGVQLVGYTQDYWMVRNSWGSFWGDNGYIYISRASDAKTATDQDPADGVACKPSPSTQTVGGECGILFDTSYPTGATLATSDVVV